MIAKSVVVSVGTQHQQSLPARTSLLLLCRVSIHYYFNSKKKYPFGQGGGVQKNLCHLGFFKVCFFFFLFFFPFGNAFFPSSSLFFCVFQKLFFSSFFRYYYKRCAKHVRPSPPHTHTYFCLLVLRLRFRAQKAAFGRDDDEREEEEGADLAFFLF